MGRAEFFSKAVLTCSTILAAYAFPLVAYLYQRHTSGADQADPLEVQHQSRFVFHVALCACVVAVTGIFAGCVQTERSQFAKTFTVTVLLAQVTVMILLTIQGHHEMAACRKVVEEIIVHRTRVIGVYPNGDEVLLGTGVMADFSIRPDVAADQMCRKDTAHVYRLLGFAVTVVTGNMALCGVFFSHSVEHEEECTGVVVAGRVVEANTDDEELYPTKPVVV